jgi:hypothetical protein
VIRLHQDIPFLFDSSEQLHLLDATLVAACDKGVRHKLGRADKQPFFQPQKDASCVEAEAVDMMYLQRNGGYSRHEKEVHGLQNDEALCHVF